MSIPTIKKSTVFKLSLGFIVTLVWGWFGAWVKLQAVEGRLDMAEIQIEDCRETDEKILDKMETIGKDVAYIKWKIEALHDK